MDAPRVPAPSPTGWSRFLTGLGGAWIAVAILWVANAEWRISRDAVVVTMIANPRDGQEVRAERTLRDPRDDVAEIYGTPVGSPIELVLRGGARSPLLITPVEQPARRLLPVEHRLDAPTPAHARLAAGLGSLGLAGAGVILYLVGRARRRRIDLSVPPPPP